MSLNIGRINELAKKKNTVGLTAEETKEQAELRRNYINAYRKDLINTMNNVSVKNEDGSISHMKDITKKKNIQ